MRLPNRGPRRAPRPLPFLVLTAAYVRSGGWVSAEIVGASGVAAQGRTLAEARRNLYAVVLDMLEAAPDQFPSGPRRGPAGARTERLVLSLR